jgi:transketolase
MSNLTDDKIKLLEEKANLIRQSIVEMLTLAGSGHTAGSLGMTDVFTYLYFCGLNHNSQKPDWPERDLIVLSNGHICPGLYATMAHAGYFPISELNNLRKFGSRLQGHPHRESLPGIETSSGPLGSGISQAIGMSLAIRLDNGPTSSRFVYCLTGDGELDEGQNWEAIMLAGKEKLHNLIVIVDRNNIQIDGYTEDVMPLLDLVKKFESFGWHAREVDGHNFHMIDEALGEAKAVFDKPSVIIARTIPGKGVHEFEYKPEWHGKAPKKEEAEKALKELRTLGGKIEFHQY